MIYEFKSQATGTVVMTKPVAEALLEAIGKDIGPRGVITVEQMPAAIARLREVSDNERDPDAADGDDSGNDEEIVPLSMRAWPLIEMLGQAHAAGKDVTWQA